MLPVNLEINNIGSYANSSISDLDKIGLALVMGVLDNNKARSNGAGKSTIFVAVRWALWGKAHCSNDMLINENQDSAYVKLSFIGQDAKLYQVTRSVKRKTDGTVSMSLDLSIWNGEKWESHDNQEAKGKKGIQQIINEKVGVDDSLFLQSAYFEQDNIDCFSKLAAGKRKEIFNQYIRVLQELEKCRKRAGSVLSDKEKERTALEAVLSKLKTGLESLDWLLENQKKISGEADTLRISLEKKEKELEVLRKGSGAVAELGRLQEQHKISLRNLANHERMQVEYQKSIDDIVASGKTKFMALKSRLEKLPEVEERKKGLLAALDSEQRNEAEYRRIKDVLAKLQAELAVFKTKEEHLLAQQAEMKQHVEHIKSLDKKCPTCFSEITDSVKENIISQFRNKYKELRDEYLANHSKLTECEMSIKASVLPAFSVEKLNTIRTDIGKCEVELASKEQFSKDMQQIKEDTKAQKEILVKHVESAVQNIASIRQTVSSLEKEIATMESMMSADAVTKLKEHETELKALKSRDEVLQRELGAVDVRIGICKKSGVEISQKERELSDLSIAISVYKELEILFGKKGMQALYIEKALATQESVAKHYLQRFSHGELDIKFRSLVVSDDGKESETLDILVRRNDGKWRDYKTFSGGERLRINFAIRVSFAKLVTEYSGAVLQSLFIDESCAPLDIDGREVYCDILNELSMDFPFILVVTHITELQDRFKNIITVVKENDVSRILPVVVS